MKKIKRYLGTIAAIVLTTASMNASALLLELQPDFTAAVPGDTVALDLVASGFDPFLGIAGYDVTLTFDEAVLSATGHTLSAAMGTTFDASFGDLGGGNYNVAGLSLEIFLPVQVDPLTLATIEFVVDPVLASINTIVDIVITEIIDGGFPPGLIDNNQTSFAEIEVTVGGGPMPMPEPAPLALLLLGVALLFVRRAR